MLLDLKFNAKSFLLMSRSNSLTDSLKWRAVGWTERGLSDVYAARRLSVRYSAYLFIFYLTPTPTQPTRKGVRQVHGPEGDTEIKFQITSDKKIQIHGDLFQVVWQSYLMAIV
ncbi:hypothetical protein AVEN_92299-1 [Araneus ventricosus]|uniref:Uncharacterized protein n=1 Tax=Araneus ventricosus TaxID=182803 RepID=A0A4Y2AL79_ARAVE|nr:hypothetical protein AVEN_92299-1 [Araneus ventricosus]